MRSVGNYVLGPQIGRGATSEVFAAEHRWLGDRAAVKLLRAELAGDGAAVGELIAEAAKLRAVQHPNVVRVLDVGSDPASGCCYLAMERVDGESLAARLRREPRLPEPEVRRLGAAIADGVAAVHAAGLVHRDLKPANVMLDGDAPKLVDFGIAKFLGGDAALATSRRIGTPAYMAPEQLTGGMIAPCVDVWALGVLLFEAATGRLPFDDFAGGRCPQLFEIAPRARTLAPVSPALDRLIARCLERDPGRRPPSMAAVARELRGEPGGDLDGERFTEDAGPIEAPPPFAAPGLPPPFIAPAPAPTPPLSVAPAPVPMARRWWLLPLLVGAAVAVGVTAAMIVRGAYEASPAPTPTASATASAAEPPRTEPAPPPAPPPAPAPAPAPEPAPAPAPEPAPPPAPAPPSPEPRATAAASAPARPRRAAWTVHVRSTPSGAQIFLGARLLGTTPRQVELTAPATLTVRYRGYQPARVRAARPGPIDVRLVRSCAHPPCEDLN